MEKSGLYNRQSITMSKAKKNVNKNFTLAVRIPFLANFLIGKRTY